MLVSHAVFLADNEHYLDLYLYSFKGKKKKEKRVNRISYLVGGNHSLMSLSHPPLNLGEIYILSKHV